jgi:hypothetical protein
MASHPAAQAGREANATIIRRREPENAGRTVRSGVPEPLKGPGTGELFRLYDALEGDETKFYLSGTSSKTRGLTEAGLQGKSYEFAYPKELVQYSLEHDRLFTY